MEILGNVPPPCQLHPNGLNRVKEPYPEAVLMAANFQIFNGDLSTVADLAATVSADFFKGPEEEEEEEGDKSNAPSWSQLQTYPSFQPHRWRGLMQPLFYAH